MSSRTILIAAAVFAAAGTTGCASGLIARMDEQQAALDAMQERLVQIGQQNDTQTQELAAVRRDLQQMGSKVTMTEEQMADLNSRTENISTRVSLLSDDVTRMKSSDTQPSGQQARPGGALQFAEGPAPATPSGSQKSVYDTALAQYYAHQPDQAMQGFARYQELAPDSDLADNAQYWIGECYYMKDQLPESLAAFQKVFTFRFTDKYDDAQLKIGMIHAQLGQKDNAIAAFRELLQKWPDSEYAGEARRRLTALGG